MTLEPRSSSPVDAVRPAIYGAGVGILVLSASLGLASGVPQEFDDLYTGTAASTAAGSKLIEVVGAFAAIGLAIAVYFFTRRLEAGLDARSLGDSWRWGAQVPLFLLLAAALAAPVILRTASGGQATFLAGLALLTVGASLVSGLVALRSMDQAGVPATNTRLPSLKRWLGVVPLLVLLALFGSLFAAAGLRWLCALLGVVPSTAAVGGILLLAAGAGGAFFVWDSRRRQAPTHAYRAIAMLQVSLLGGAAFLFPPPVVADGEGFVQATWHSPVGLVIVGAILTLGVVQVVRRYSAAARGSTEPPLAAIPVALGAVALAQQSLYPVVWSDGYHFGEWIAPAALLDRFGQLPYVDQVPARGILVNYLPAWIADLVAQPWAGVMPWGLLWLTFLLSLLAWSLIRRVIDWPLAYALVVLPAGLLMSDALAVIDVVMIFSIVLLAALIHRRRQAWWLLPLWTGVGTVLVLLAPARGAGTAAVGALLLVLPPHKLGGTGRRAAGAVGGAFGVLLVLAATPLREPVVAAVRYIREQGAVNSQVWGVPWTDSIGEQGPLPEVIRAALLVAIVILAVLTVRAWPTRSADAAFTTTAGLTAYLVLAVPQALGRIDPEWLSRIGLASTAALVIALPLAFGLARPTSRWASLVPAALGFALLAGYLSAGVPLQRAVANVPDPGLTEIAGEPGLATLSRAVVPDDVRERVERMTRVVRSAQAEGSPVLNLTNYQADFAYLNVDNPVESTAVLNITSREQEARAVEQLQENPPDMVVADVDSVWFDGVSLSLRNPLIYRYVLDTTVPYTCGSDTYGFAEGTRVPACTAVPDDRRADAWQLAVGAPTYLRWMPLSWGRGAADYSLLIATGDIVTEQEQRPAAGM